MRHSCCHSFDREVLVTVATCSVESVVCCVGSFAQTRVARCMLWSFLLCHRVTRVVSRFFVRLVTHIISFQGSIRNTAATSSTCLSTFVCVVSLYQTVMSRLVTQLNPSRPHTGDEPFATRSSAFCGDVDEPDLNMGMTELLGSSSIPAGLGDDWNLAGTAETPRSND